MPGDQDAFDQQIAEEIRDSLADWLENETETALALIVEEAPITFAWGVVTVVAPSQTAFRYLDERRPLIAEGLCCVCDYLVPLTLEAPVRSGA